MHVRNLTGGVLYLFEMLLALAASLKLAICVILGLAAFLALATLYEARYGAPAAQAVVYGSTSFLLVMVLLAINVAAAVIVRYPFKRRQTGFVITHIGIEVLLLGCLISYGRSQEGMLELRPAQKVDSINSISEGLFVSWKNDDQVRQEGIPVRCWLEAGFPSPAEFAWDLVRGESRVPTWRQDELVAQDVAPGVRLEVANWLPAAAFERVAIDDPAGSPAVQLRVFGQTPNGMAQDERVWLHQDDSAGAVVPVFGGMIEAVLWRARTPVEVAHFLQPPSAESLPQAGQLIIYVGEMQVTLSVNDAINKPTRVDDQTQVTLLEYFPEARWDGQKLVRSNEQATDPMVRVKLQTPQGEEEWIASARYPYLNGPLKVGKDRVSDRSPAFIYDHPSVFITQRDGQRGRLQLLQGPDGKLYGRRFGLKGLIEAAELKVGEESPAFMGLKMVVLDSRSSARVADSYRRANVDPKKMAESMRAAKVALTVDGKRHEAWLARGASPKVIQTSRGPMTVFYGFESIRLPYQIALKTARMMRDPGSANAASYESDVQRIEANGASTNHLITMNEPMTAGGFTFYQSGFNDSIPDGPMTVLSMRRDPGWIVKYAGCALIVAGIFTMFYMKAYFQKSAATRVEKNVPRDMQSPRAAPVAAMQEAGA